MFSRRTRWITAPSELAQALARVREDAHASARLIDLTGSNPTALGLHPDAAEIRALLDEAFDAAYKPQALGLLRAREAVLDYYPRRAPGVGPEDVCLCAGTSEAYANLLALLCDPGDVVLVPSPGYPLLSYLADLQGVVLAPYAHTLDGARAWRVDLEDVRRRLAKLRRDGRRVRAVTVVAPNNPTGNYLDAHELAELDALCRAHELALIVDEVFYDYPLSTAATQRRRRPLERPRGCLSFTLSGLSKIAALPQLKLSWLIAHGPAALVRDAMRRLELIADSFLSVAGPVQGALPRLLQTAPRTQARVLARTRKNLATLRTRCRERASAVTPLEVEAGWTALLRLPAIGSLDDAGWTLDLLQRAAVVCQPGYLFDLDDRGGARPILAVSLLSDPNRFSAAVDRVLDRVAAVVASGP